VVGVVGGIGAFIPYFALAVGMVPAVVLSAAQHQDVLHPLAAAGVFAFGMAVDNLLVTPSVIGKSVGMHPVIIILSILIFGTLFGFLGIIFAIPIAAVIKVLFLELLARYKKSSLYSAQPEGQ
jgi:predicted PurR-regulated permease PerM